MGLFEETMARKHKAIGLTLTCLVSLLLFACSSKQLAKPARLKPFTEQLDTMIFELSQRDYVSGVAVGLIHNGEVVWVQGYGLAEKANGTPVTPDTVFQVGSIAKSVNAWGVMRLVQRGRLNLDVPAERYLMRWHLPPSEFDHNGVAIRRLLSHTSGLSLHGYPGFEPNQLLPSLEESLSRLIGVGPSYVSDMSINDPGRLGGRW